MVLLALCHFTPQMADPKVYLFWNPDMKTSSEEVLLSGDTFTTTLSWDTSRNHYATSGCIATGTHSGILIGSDFDAVTIEPFVVVSSNSCLYIQIRTELSLCATSLPLNTSKPITSPLTDTSLPLAPADFGSSSDYYDHLIEEGEDHYKVPKDILRGDIYQVPSNVLVEHIQTGTIPLTADSVPSCKQNGTETNHRPEKMPLFQHRHPRSHSNSGMLENESHSGRLSPLSSLTKTSLPTNCTPSGNKTPVAAPRPRKVKEGLDISVEIPVHYDTCKSSNQVVKKQVSECGTRATDPVDLSPVLPVERVDSAPLRPLRHPSIKRPHTSGPILSNPTVSKECSSPLPQPKIFSQLSVTHHHSEDSLHPSLSPVSPGVSSFPQEEPSPVIEGVKSVSEVATQSEDCSLLKSEITSLKKQLSVIKIEHSKLLGGEVCVRQRLELELKNGRQECVRVKSLLEKATQDLDVTFGLLREERKTCEILRCEIMELKLKLPEKPKILKKPILAKPTKKV